MISRHDKEELNRMWERSKSKNSVDLPEGTYQFKVTAARFHVTDKGKPQIKSTLKVVGGGVEHEGVEFEVTDNLETQENMGWFKRKLGRLGVDVPEDMGPFFDQSLPESLVGLVFEGQVKVKNDFLNVYVNRLLGEDRENGKTAKDAEYEETALSADDNGDEAQKEPGTKEVGNFTMLEIKEYLAGLSLDARKVKNARQLASDIAGLRSDEAYTPKLTGLASLCDALKYRVPKGERAKDTIEGLRELAQNLGA